MADEVAPNVSDQTFPVVDESEISPPAKKSLEVDPVSSELDVIKEVERKQDEAVIERKKAEKKDAMQTLKSAVIVSAVIVAVAGAIFAITKKLKEK